MTTPERWRVALVFEVNAANEAEAYACADSITQQVVPTEDTGDCTLNELVVELYRLNRI